MFIGFGDDGEPRYDSKESAIERAQQLIKWEGESEDKIFVTRDWVPLWFAHVVRGTFFQRLAYYEYKEKC